MSELRVAVVVRVGTPGSPAFQLRKGEAGLSVFDPDAADPPLTEDEILDAFRPGSFILYRTVSEITALGLAVLPSEGDDSLPDRVRLAHREIRPGQTMSRPSFKAALKDLEE